MSDSDGGGTDGIYSDLSGEPMPIDAKWTERERPGFSRVPGLSTALLW